MAIALNSPQAFESTKRVIDTLAAYVQDRAMEQGLLLPEDRWFFDDPAIRDQESYDQAQMLKAMMSMASHKGDAASRLRIAKYLATERIVLNALDYYYRASVVPEPKDMFTQFLQENLGGDAIEQQRFVAALRAARGMEINLVQTMHPTIYHTEFAIRREAELTQALEQGVREERSADGLIEEAQKHIDRLIDGVITGNAITYNTQITVAQENKLDHLVHVDVRDEMTETIKAYNAALQEFAVAHPEIPGLAELTLEQLDVVYRAWTFDADADGRNATALGLHSGIEYQTTEPHIFRSRMRDVRESAPVIMSTADALMQRERIMRGEMATPQLIRQPDGDQDALRANRINALKARLQGSASLLPPVVRTETIAFCRDVVGTHFPAFRDACIARHRELAHTDEAHALEHHELVERLQQVSVLGELATLFPPAVRSGERPQSLMAEFRSYIAEQDFSIGDETGIRFILDPERMTFERRNLVGHSRFFEGVADDRAADGFLNQTDRDKNMETIKRAIMLDSALIEYNGSVASRYQLAGFSGADDFYAAMLLFREAGLLSTENGHVTQAKLNIQPLLESAEDQQNARATFEQLLADPMVKEYYARRGNKAEIMLGYSDGAKSAGNFASEWSILRCARELEQLFVSQDPSITLSVFHGRGRGYSRGGQYDLGQAERMKAQGGAMRVDRTLQSDEPLEFVVSPAYGRHQAGRILEGVITASLEAEQMGGAIPGMDELERQIGEIAAASAQQYIKLVRINPNTVNLIKSVPETSLISSRPPKRVGDDFDNIRAITFEYACHKVDAPLHFVGLKSALEAFTAAHGIAELTHLYQTHPFFHGMMDKTAQAMLDYHKATFESHAKAAGLDPQWVRDCTAELDGLRDLVLQIQGPEAVIEQNYGKTMDDAIATILATPPNSPEEKARQQALLLQFNPIGRYMEREDRLAHELELVPTLSDQGEIEGKPRGTDNPMRPADPNSPEAETYRLLQFVTTEQAKSMRHTPAQISRGVDTPGGTVTRSL